MNDKEIAVVRLTQADSKTREVVQAIQSILTKDVIDFVALKHSLIELFEYLSSENGRTDKNCCAVDSFFTHDELWAERNLPDPFNDIFADIAGALHDTVSAPDIAENFESTPEQLLKRARGLSTEQVN